jgi:hypothetical protein
LAKAAPFLITLVILLVLSLAVTTLLKGTAAYDYVSYINVALALIIVLPIYPKLKNVMDRYDRNTDTTGRPGR